MEVIKKTVKRKMTTSGDTEIIIIPDLTAIYYFNFNLNNEIKDWGFFDAYTEKEEAQTETEFDFLEDDPEIIIPDEDEPEITEIQVETGSIVEITITYTDDNGSGPIGRTGDELPNIRD